MCESTNDEARKLAQAASPHGTVVTADAQTRGRGRQGRSFYSPCGQGLYLSLLLRPDWPVSKAPLLTLGAGLAVYQAAVRAVFAGSKARLQLKWPNDLLLDTPHGLRKAAGILTEAVVSAQTVQVAIVGVGVNLTGTDFPPELSAASLLQLQPDHAAPVSPKQFALLWLDCFADVLRRLGAQGSGWLIEAFLAAAPAVAPGKRVTVSLGQNPVVGESLGLGADGALLLRNDRGGLETIHCGELLV